MTLPELRAGWTERDMDYFARVLARESAPSAEGWLVVSLPLGHAAAIEGVRRATEMIETGEASLCVVGGVDTYVDADALLALDVERRLAAPGVRSGFPPGEAAAFIAIASESARLAVGLPSLARIEGASTSREPRHSRTRAVVLGEGLTMAMRGAMASLGPGDGVDDVYCDINGERYRTEEWGFATLRLGERFRAGGSYRTAVGQCGDVGAATGALLAVLATRAWQRAYASGPRALVWASSMGSLRGAMLLSAPEV